MEAPPRSPLEMIQAELAFHLLIALLHRPAALPEPDSPQSRCPRRQVAESVLQLAVSLALDQQPDRLGKGAAARGPAAARPDPQPGVGVARTTSLVPSRPFKVTLCKGVWAASSLRLTGRAAPSAKWGRLRGRPPLPAGLAAGPGNSQVGSSVKTTISSVDFG